MKDYMYIIRGGEDIAALKSPEELQQHMQKWQTWMGGIAQAGQFIAGQPLMREGKSLTNGGATVVDRPLAEAKELVAGYLIFKASSLDEAVQLAKGCPGFEHDCTIEVREIRPM